MSKRLDANGALDLCILFGIHSDRLDWHAMPWDQKEAVLAAADHYGYRKPKNANGSRGRCFAAYLSRAIESENDDGE